MISIAYFIQIRMASIRFPGKVLAPILDNIKVIDLLIQRIRQSRFYHPDRWMLLTTTSSADEPLAAYFKKNGWPFLRGSEDNVFSRFQEACRQVDATHFFRICADNPLIEPDFLDQLVMTVQTNPRFDYISFLNPDGLPVIRTHYGFFGELIRTGALLQIDIRKLQPQEREHVTPVFYNNPKSYQLKFLPVPDSLVNDEIRLTIDTPQDLETVRKIIAHLPPHFHIDEVYQILKENQSLVNEMKQQIEKYAK